MNPVLNSCPTKACTGRLDSARFLEIVLSLTRKSFLTRARARGMVEANRVTRVEKALRQEIVKL